MYSAIFKFKFAYPSGSSPRSQSSPSFAYASAPAVARMDDSTDHMFLDGAGVASMHMSGSMGSSKSGYNYQSFDGAWDMPELSPTHSGGFTDSRSASSGYTGSRSNSISPTVAHFPPHLYNYVRLLLLSFSMFLIESDRHNRQLHLPSDISKKKLCVLYCYR